MRLTPQKQLEQLEQLEHNTSTFPTLSPSCHFSFTPFLAIPPSIELK